MSILKCDLTVGATRLSLGIVHDKVVLLGTCDVPVKIDIGNLDAADQDWLVSAVEAGRPTAELPPHEKPLTDSMLLTRALVRLLGSDAEVARHSGYTTQQVKSWLAGRSTPHHTTLTRLRRLLPYMPKGQAQVPEGEQATKLGRPNGEHPAEIARDYYVKVKGYKPNGEYLEGADTNGVMGRARIFSREVLVERRSGPVWKIVGRYGYKAYQLELWRKKLLKAGF